MRISSVSRFSFILYYWVCLSISISLVSGHCLEDQKMLLLQLKNELNFNSTISTKLVLWNESLPCCDWNGVTCDEVGHVTGLDLSQESISGGLDNASTLFSLQYLQNLNLAKNDFWPDQIPSEIIKLKNLTCLNLSSAGFEGQIPVEIGKLTRLVILDLSDNYHYFELENPNLVKLVQNLSEIRELYLDDVDISLEGKEWGQALSSSLPHLQVLSMSRCNLKGPIHSSLQALKNLSVIYLDENDLLYGHMPKWFTNFTYLTNLNLASCSLSGKLPNEIFQVQSLSTLDLSKNYGLQVSFPSFPMNGSLQELILSCTSFSGGVPDSLSSLRHLSRLDISDCLSNGTLSASMANLKELTYLDLSLNNFTGSIPLFGMAKKLTYVDFSYNQFSGGISYAHFKGLRELVSLNLTNNLLNGSIPTSLFTLPLLESLDLSSNKLEGPIPEFIFLLKRLNFLDLSQNKFNGTIELDMILRLENIRFLDLSNNNLSIDSNVKDSHLSSFPKTMTDVSLASCKLKEIPRFLRNQSRLVNLDLSNNQISGTIPNWIWQSDSIKKLNFSHNSLMMLERPLRNVSFNFFVVDLHDNNLQGSLPTFLESADYLDYSSNNFSSAIPPDFFNNLFLTEFLSLSHNFLHQRIPNSICNASNLLVLDLSYNKFDGMIPHCLATIDDYDVFNNLGVLNLRANNLTGDIPDKFQGSCNLRTLDLNGNNLQGAIPKSLSSCTSLEVLDLGNNKINDTFPCFLNHVSTLQLLVLRNNNFRGSIGCLKTTKIWNKLQIVDLAFNNFNGTLQGKLFKRWKTMMLDEHQATSKFNHLHFGDQDRMYYQDQVIVTSKGQEMIMKKILSVFTLVDFSSNQIEGPIPKEMMDFKSLHCLNLSNNAFSGQIPSSIGNLKQLESLDLSNNSFAGEIPTKLASLSFLEFLNISFNHLEGKIPTGTQIQSFDATSFIGNPGLCGAPLLRDCSDHELIDSPEVVHHTNSRFEFEWQFVFPGVVFGLGIIIGPLFYKKEWRIWYWNFVDNILCSIFPQLYHEFQTHEGQTYKVLRWSH